MPLALAGSVPAWPPPWLHTNLPLLAASKWANRWGGGENKQNVWDVTIGLIWQITQLDCFSDRRIISVDNKMVQKNNPRVSNFPSLQHDLFDLRVACLLFRNVCDVLNPSGQSAAASPDRFASFTHSHKSVSQARQTSASSNWKSLEEPDQRNIHKPGDANLTLGLFFRRDSVLQCLHGRVSVFCFHKQIV